jgi:hypothetical protein
MAMGRSIAKGAEWGWAQDDFSNHAVVAYRTPGGTNPWMKSLLCVLLLKKEKRVYRE